MTHPLYTVAVDLNDDGGFGDAGEVITAKVLRARWRLGMDAPHDAIAAPIAAEIVLFDPAGDFAPAAGASALLPGKRLRIQATHNSMTYTLFTGVISAVQPARGSAGGREALIFASGPERWLRESSAGMPLMVDASADDAIQAALEQAALRRPSLAATWVLGVVGHSELGQTTTLPAPYPASLENGVSRFAYIGMSDAQTERSAADLIREVVVAERGRFFVDRDGALVFYNRHHMLLDVTPLAVFEDDMDGLDYQFGAEVVNRVSVVVTPRSIGLPETVLWTLENGQEIPAEGERLFTARYRDDSDNPIAALMVIQPQPIADYVLNTKSDGTGEDYSGRARVVVEKVGADAALIRIVNPHPFRLFLQQGATLRGTPLIGGDPVTVEQAALTSQTFYGLRGLTLDLPIVDDLETAEQIARFELARRKDPRGVVRALHLTGTLHIGQILARTLFDRLRIIESKTEHEGEYFIIAEDHTLDQGGARHRVTWLLESAAANAFWIVGTSTFDETTILAY